MAKVAGIPTAFDLDNTAGTPVTFSNQVASISLNISAAQQDVSGLDVEGTERIQLRGDWSASITGAGMSAADVIPVFGDIRNSRTLDVTYPSGVTFGGEGIISNFVPVVNQDGSWNWTAELLGSDGVFPALEI